MQLLFALMFSLLECCLLQAPFELGEATCWCWTALQLDAIAVKSLDSLCMHHLLYKSPPNFPVIGCPSFNHRPTSDTMQLVYWR